MTPVDPSRFPRVAAYLASLPNGLGSHPSCRCKSSGIRVMVDTTPFKPERGGLPDELVELWESPPPATVWVDEVQVVALSLAIRDWTFETDALWLGWRHDLNLAIFRSQIYRGFMSGGTPATTTRGMADRWKLLHTGTISSGILTGDRTATFRLTYPAALFPELHVKGLAVATAAALENAGAADVKSTLAELNATQARIECAWS